MTLPNDQAVISEQTLLACPFCGGVAATQHYRRGSWGAGCTNNNCPAVAEAYAPSRAKAIAAWNTRSLPSTSEQDCDEEEVERVIEQLTVLIDRQINERGDMMTYGQADEAIVQARALLRSLSTIRKAEPQSDAVREAVLAEADRERLEAMLAEDHDHMAASGEKLAWLLEQTMRWPVRIDERFTTNDRFLRFSLVATVLAFASRPTGEDTAETWETINQWCDDTFGPATPLRMVERAKEEFVELEDAVEAGDIPAAAIEAADVVICLCRIPGFADALQRKMAVNRARKWRLTGEGTGYHIPDDAHQSKDSSRE